LSALILIVDFSIYDRMIRQRSKDSAEGKPKKCTKRRTKDGINEGNGTQKRSKPSTVNSFVIDKSGRKMSTGVRFDVNALSSISQKLTKTVSKSMFLYNYISNK